MIIVRKIKRVSPKPLSSPRKDAFLPVTEGKYYFSDDKNGKSIEKENPQPGRGGDNLGDMLGGSIKERRAAGDLMRGDRKEKRDVNNSFTEDQDPQGDKKDHFLLHKGLGCYFTIQVVQEQPITVKGKHCRFQAACDPGEGSVDIMHPRQTHGAGNGDDHAVQCPEPEGNHQEFQNESQGQ
jgi:hypothetical protein